MKLKSLAIIMIMTLLSFGCNNTSINESTDSPILAKHFKPIDLQLGGAWVIYFQHSSGTVTFVFDTLIYRYWLEPPLGADEHTLNNIETPFRIIIPEFEQTGDRYDEGSAVPGWTEWRWQSNTFDAFVVINYNSGFINGELFKHPDYYFTWELEYYRTNSNDLFTFEGSMVLENGEEIDIFGNQTRRDPGRIIGATPEDER